MGHLGCGFERDAPSVGECCFFSDTIRVDKSSKSDVFPSVSLLTNAISRNGGLLEKGLAMSSVPDRAPDLITSSGKSVQPKPLSII